MNSWVSGGWLLYCCMLFFVFNFSTAGGFLTYRFLVMWRLTFFFSSRMDKIEMRDLWKPLKFLGSKIRVFISLILLLPFHLSGLRCQDCYGWVKYLTACSWNFLWTLCCLCCVTQILLSCDGKGWTKDKKIILPFIVTSDQIQAKHILYEGHVQIWFLVS